MLSRLLYSENIVKGESRDKEKTKFSSMTMPSRLLYSENKVKGESRDKEEKIILYRAA